MGTVYDYRFVRPAREAAHNPGKFIVYKAAEEGWPIATCKTREDAELITNALNAPKEEGLGQLTHDILNMHSDDPITEPDGHGGYSRVARPFRTLSGK